MPKQNQKPPLIVILGPTGSGKSELALKLAKKFDGEIINADSRQIYKEMIIGTGSPLGEITNYKLQITNKSKIQNPKSKIHIHGIPHHLFHIMRPNQEFTVAHYKKMAIKTIQDIQKRGKIPFLVGGTGLYIQAVVDNLEIPAVPPNKKLRAEFESALSAGQSPSAKSTIIKKYYKKLLKLDPRAANIVDPNNPRRIIRALEVCLATGEPFSQLQQKGEPLFNVLQIGINLSRKELYKKIDQRVDEMINPHTKGFGVGVKQGLVEETKKLMKKYPSTLPAMSGIGYQEITEYLKSSASSAISAKSAIQHIKYRTHAYARRQITWFKKDKRIIWITSLSQAEKLSLHRLGL